ncbi:hypothetical protein KFE25_010920 [Diacronema lutheri]|uniref:Uncharacterized protein n=1 Tax=Diacronema lutheri TaxID=2081491 RepID=A0A8J5X163_DIALT|nr:hypothetical protein KFE25_009797 [Diacronema lutheri]KAG8460865.1 hypothetical protein KFE25_010920 [Diacronema lutheri]
MRAARLLTLAALVEARGGGGARSFAPCASRALRRALPSRMLLPDDAAVAADAAARTAAAAAVAAPGAMVVPGVSAGAAPWVALGIALPTLAVLRAVAADARAIGWERARPRRFLIRWCAPRAARYELPTGGSALMVAGEGNAEAFSSLQECLALGRQLERTFARAGGASTRGATVALRFDAAGNPLPAAMRGADGAGAGVSGPPRARAPTGPPLSYRIYEVRQAVEGVRAGEGDDSGGTTALVVRGSFPKAVNARGSHVRASADAARVSRDPLSADSLGDAWREVFESYSTELDDEWLRFRQSLMEVGGSRLRVVRDDGEDGEDEDDDTNSDARAREKA